MGGTGGMGGNSAGQLPTLVIISSPLLREKKLYEIPPIPPAGMRLRMRHKDF
jgi:hypothetical protein